MSEVRVAQPGDRVAVEALCARARYKLPQMWHWEEHLGTDSFVVTGCTGSVTGVALAWSDQSPVAWVRMAALADGSDVDEWLTLVLSVVADNLRRSGSAVLAWMDYDGWLGPYLKAHGFTPLIDVMTLAKSDRGFPVASLTDAHLRLAVDGDVPAVVAVDRAAFSPHWWHSQDTVRRRFATSSHFAVAELAGKVFGYVEGEMRRPLAHLNRIAVHPAYQSRGVGAALLCDALHSFWRQGADYVTLNTQSDNHASRRLYRRFGFEMTGDFATVWELQL